MTYLEFFTALMVAHNPPFDVNGRQLSHYEHAFSSIRIARRTLDCLGISHTAELTIRIQPPQEKAP